MICFAHSLFHGKEKSVSGPLTKCCQPCAGGARTFLSTFLSAAMFEWFTAPETGTVPPAIELCCEQECSGASRFCVRRGVSGSVSIAAKDLRNPSSNRIHSG